MRSCGIERCELQLWNYVDDVSSAGLQHSPECVWVVVNGVSDSSCSCLFEQNLGVGGGALCQGAGWAALKRGGVKRERGHFFGVSQCGERPGSLPAGLTALSRNVCDWRPGWGHAPSFSTEAKQWDQPHGLRRCMPALYHT